MTRMPRTTEGTTPWPEGSSRRPVISLVSRSSHMPCAQGTGGGAGRQGAPVQRGAAKRRSAECSPLPEVASSGGDGGGTGSGNGQRRLPPGRRVVDLQRDDPLHPLEA